MLWCRDQLFVYQLLAIEMLVYADLFVFSVIICCYRFSSFGGLLIKLVSLKNYSSKCHTSVLVLVANQGRGQGGAPPVTQVPQPPSVSLESASRAPRHGRDKGFADAESACKSFTAVMQS